MQPESDQATNSVNLDTETKPVKTHDEFDIFLSGLGLLHLKGQFAIQGIRLSQALSMTKLDLRKLGIKGDDASKFLEASKSILESLSYDGPQSSLEPESSFRPTLTPAEMMAISSNLKDHKGFIQLSFEYLMHLMKNTPVEDSNATSHVQVEEVTRALDQTLKSLQNLEDICKDIDLPSPHN